MTLQPEIVNDDSSCDLGSIKAFMNELKTEIIASITTTIDQKLTNITNDFNSIQLKLEQKDHEIAELNHKIDEQSEMIQRIDAVLDDQINRSCRSTLIVRNVKEEKNENWEMTTQILAKVVCKYCSYMNKNVELDHVLYDIDRAHRTGEKKENGQPRPITVKLISWKASERLRSTIIKVNSGKTKLTADEKMYVEQKHSKRVTDRRNLAKQERKELKRLDEYKDAKIYIAYPATMMIMKQNDKKYNKHKEF